MSSRAQGTAESPQVEKRDHGSAVEQVHGVITTDQGDTDPWVVAEEIVQQVQDDLLRQAMDYFMARDGIGYVVEMLARRRETGRWSDG